MSPNIVTMNIILIALGIHLSVAVPCSERTETLCVNQVNEMGFGDLTNQYAFAMEVFKGQLYVATLNSIESTGIALFFFGQPFPTTGGQIWRTEDTDTLPNQPWEWERVVSNGLGLRGGGEIDLPDPLPDIDLPPAPWNYGVRKFTVAGEFLYAVTGNHVNGFEIWKTSTGDDGDWDIVMQGGFEEDINTSGRGLGSFNGFLYVGVENRVNGAQIWRHALMPSGDLDGSSWVKVATDGLGFFGNWWFSDFVEYNGFLYTGTLNIAGMQLWRTADGITWQQIFAQGNGNPFETGCFKLYVYNGRLYIGTFNLFQGASLLVNTDLVGLVFEYIFVAGNGNPENTYTWYMEEYRNRLYVGMFDRSGELDLFSSDDPLNPDRWIIETNDAFGNENFYGVRSMAVFENQLMIGSATATQELGCIVWSATDDLPGNPNSAHNADEKGDEQSTGIHLVFELPTLSSIVNADYSKYTFYMLMSSLVVNIIAFWFWICQKKSKKQQKIHHEDDSDAL